VRALVLTLSVCNLTNGAVPCVLPHTAGADWSWSWADYCGSDVTISRGGTTASKSGDEWRLITGGEAMTAGGGRGREYWEVHISETPNDACGILIGAVTSNLNPDEAPGSYQSTKTKAANGTYFISSLDGSVVCNGKLAMGRTMQRFKKGDKIGVLLDLDEQWVRFYLNGARCGGIAGGVTGPLVRAVQVKQAGTVVSVVPSYEQARTASR
jgi:hypothetical protein